MPINRSIIKIFLASPGDLTEERRAAKRIVEEENINHAVVQGYQFELVGWEDTVAQHGRAQEIINRDLDQCNFFVGLVWKRWGTPPGPSDGPYSSGFEEEYERSEARFKATGKPSISLLLKNIGDDDKRDAGPQLAKVLSFRKKFTEDYRGAYQTFDEIRDFEQRFRSIIAFFLRKQIEEDKYGKSEEKSRSSLTEIKQNTDFPISGIFIFENDVRKFINSLIERPSQETGHEYSATEAARFRLLAKTLQLSQNDDETLGVHDSNLIFVNLRNDTLSAKEKRGLLKAGLTQFESQTAPFWHWLYRQNRPIAEELSFQTLVGNSAKRKSAFKVLTLLSEGPHGLSPLLERQKLVEWWLSTEKDNDLVIAALAYLGRCGSNLDLQAIDGHLNSSETTVSRAATSAKTQILARDSINQALEFIASREDAEISESLTATLLAKPATIETGLLKKCAANRSIEFRRAVASELFNRDAIEVDEARALTQSTDARTRLLGAKSLRKRSIEFSLSDARSAIVKPKRQNALGLLSTGNFDYPVEEAFDEYKHEFLCERKYEELIELRKTEGIFNYDISFALYDGFFKKMHTELIRNIKDDFKEFISQKRNVKLDQSSSSDEKIDEYVRGEALQKAVQLLCSKKSKSDIALIRSKIDEGKIKFSKLILDFLKQYGNWEDVARIAVLCNEFPYRGVLLLSISSNMQSYADSARVALALGKGRIGDLITLEMPSGLRDAIFREMSKNAFQSFDDHKIDQWLRSESDNFRKTIALKAVLCFPKKRIESILEKYMNDGDRYYYNVVFWLDLGATADKTTATKVARAEFLYL